VHDVLPKSSLLLNSSRKLVKPTPINRTRPIEQPLLPTLRLSSALIKPSLNPESKDGMSPGSREELKSSPKSDDENEELCMLRHTRNGELSQRRDVIFKTIIRDMRKFYINDFNECTGYVKRKRYKRKDFYLTCVDEYIECQHIKAASTNGSRHIKDFNIYLGALIYPKELEAILHKKPQKRIAEEVYDALYKFSLGKMKNLLMKDAIFNLFLTYYNREIKNGDRLNLNKTMNQHKALYAEAFKVMSGLNKRSKTLV